MKTAGIVALLLTLLATSALAAAGPLEIIGQKAASGNRATVVLGGTAEKPTEMIIRVTSVPVQKIKGTWTLVCEKAAGKKKIKTGSKSGKLAGRTPVTRLLRFPMKRPDSCTASAISSLARSGRITVTIYSR